jgi:hypothetical protein
LPDGLFSYQKYQFGYTLEGIEMENVDIFWRALEWKMLVHYKAIWKFCGHLEYFSPFWYISPRNIWQPWSQNLFAKKLFICSHLGSHSMMFCQASSRAGADVIILKIRSQKNRQKIGVFCSKYC